MPYHRQVFQRTGKIKGIWHARDILFAYEHGMTLPEIARVLGVQKTAAFYYLKKARLMRKDTQIVDRNIYGSREPDINDT